MRFGIPVAGKLCQIKFPAYGVWDQYVVELATLFNRLGAVIQDAELDVTEIDPAVFPAWCRIMSIGLQVRQVRDLVEHIFLTYLRPEVPELTVPPAPRFKVKPGVPMTEDDHLEAWRADYTKQWLRRHMGIDHLFAMFQSIVQIEQWLKKKSILTLKALFSPAASPVEPPSTAGSLKSSESPLQPSAGTPPFTFN